MIALLRALYEPAEPWPVVETGTMEDWLADARLFRIAPQLYSLLKQSGRQEPAALALLDSLAADFHRSTMHNLYLRHMEEQKLQLLEQAGIPVIPLKGVSFAERYFGAVGARLSSDIDLLVPQCRLDEAAELMVSSGCRYETTKDHHARLHLPNGLLIELHWTLDKAEWSELRPDRFWEHSAPREPQRWIRRLSDLDCFYFMVLHGARHQMDSPRYVLDLAQLLYRLAGAVDLGALMAQARSDRTLRRVQAVLSIVYEVFPGFHLRKPLPFDPLDTFWSYEIVRNARLGIRTRGYYGYKLFFRHRMFDTFKHRMHSIVKSY